MKAQITDYTTSVAVNNSPEEVFTAVNNVGGWWSGEIEGSANSLDDEFTYRVGDVHFSRQKVVELVPSQKIVWLVTESNLSFIQDKGEWTGTKLIFDISTEGNKSTLRFTHKGLVPGIECFNDCSNAWSQLIHQSLLSLITTGKGKNIFG